MEPVCEFRLPIDEFADLMFERRLDGKTASSPPAYNVLDPLRASTIEDTEGV